MHNGEANHSGRSGGHNRTCSDHVQGLQAQHQKAVPFVNFFPEYLAQSAAYAALVLTFQACLASSGTGTNEPRQVQRFVLKPKYALPVNKRFPGQNWKYCHLTLALPFLSAPPVSW